MAQIEVRNLRKVFRVAERRPGLRGAFAGLFRRTVREVAALDGVDFDIEHGELVGYIGPNGAGKSTTIKILSGILTPTSGSCVIDGLTPWRSRLEHASRIGVVFGQRTQLWWDLPVVESFELLQRIYRIPPADYERNKARLVGLLDLGALLDTPVRQLSLGQRMRADLAAAMLHEPRLLFLDEPTIGLDAPAKLAMRDHVKALNEDSGVTVVLTTHDMDDIEALARRIMVIGQGRILIDGGVDELRRRLGEARVLIVDFEVPMVDTAVRGALAGIPVASLALADGRARIDFDTRDVSPATLIAEVTARLPVRDLFVEHPPIERAVAELYAQLEVPADGAPARAAAPPGAPPAEGSSFEGAAPPGAPPAEGSKTHP